MSSEETSKAEPDDVNESFRRQGSLRRVLPSIPSGDSQHLSMSAKMIDRPAVANRINHNMYKQYQQEYSLISEYNMLQKQDLSGVYVIPSAHSSLLWYGVIFVRQGIYHGGVFRFKILIPEEFPDGGCPKVVFESNIFHPMIHEDTGEFDLRNGFQDWRKNVNRIWQVLHFIRRAFYKFETKTPVNEFANELYMSNIQEFQNRVQLCVKESQERIYDLPPTDDPHYISFEPYSEEIHGPVKDFIFNRKDEEGDSMGPSWVQPGSLQPFSKPDS